MYRFTITAFLAGAFYASAIGQEKQGEQNEEVKKVIEIIRQLEKRNSLSQNDGRYSKRESDLISQIGDPKNTVEDLLKLAKKSLKDFPNEEKVLGKYISVLEKMAVAKKAQASEKNEIKKLIYELTEQTDFGDFSTKDSKNSAAKLLAIGKPAIPYLIDELENDFFTRSLVIEIIINNKVPREVYVLRVGDCVYGILKKITGQSFGDHLYIHDPADPKKSPKEVRERAKKWWEQHK